MRPQHSTSVIVADDAQARDGTPSARAGDDRLQPGLSRRHLRPRGARPPRVEPFPLAQAKEGATVIVERITEEAEADKKLLEYLWRNEVRPGRRLKIVEVAPWAGTITAGGDGPTIALGLPAAAKIWVYRPTDA